jgi:O-antigen/teichoic acid export membrane protein
MVLARVSRLLINILSYSINVHSTKEDGLSMNLCGPIKPVQNRRLGFLFQDIVIYGGAAAISQALTLITFPILIRHFSVAEYGTLDYFIVLGGFLTTLFIFGQDSGVARYFYEFEARTERCQIISESLMLQMTGLTFILPFLWLWADWIAVLLIQLPSSVWLFKLVLLQLPFLMLINFSQNLLKWTFARSQYLIMSLGFTLVRAAMIALALLVLDVGIEGVLLMNLATSAVFGIVGLLLVRGWLLIPTIFRNTRQLLIFSMPIGVICTLSAFSPILERTLTEQLLGTTHLGIYSAGTKIALLIGLLVVAFQTAWGPFSLSIHKQFDAGITYNLVLKLFSIVICAMVLALSILAQPLVNLLAPDGYAGAVVIVFPLAFGMAIEATSWITEIGIGISKRSHLNLYAYALFVVVTIAGILFLVPVLGLLGLALGVMIGHIAKALLISWLAQRAYPLPWQYPQVVVVFGLTLIVGLISIEIGHRWGVWANAVALCAGMIIVMGMGCGILLNRSERKRLTVYIRSQFSK